jgi:hypothetical protein
MRLAAALAAIPGVPREMVEKAQDGYYHDYLSPLTFPEIQLVTDLRELATRPATPRNSRPLLKQLAQDVIDGKHDATKEESDAWAQSDEGQETFRELLYPQLDLRRQEDTRPHYAVRVDNLPPTEIHCKCGEIFQGKDPISAIMNHMDKENP